MRRAFICGTGGRAPLYGWAVRVPARKLGSPVAFLFGWSQLVLIRASATGAISTVFSEYLLRSLGYDPAAHGNAADSVAAAAIVGTAAANIRGVRLGVAIVGVSTAMKFGALALMVLVSLALGGTAGASVPTSSRTAVRWTRGCSALP